MQNLYGTMLRVSPETYRASRERAGSNGYGSLPREMRVINEGIADICRFHMPDIHQLCLMRGWQIDNVSRTTTPHDLGQTHSLMDDNLVGIYTRILELSHESRLFVLVNTRYHATGFSAEGGQAVAFDINDLPLEERSEGEVVVQPSLVTPSPHEIVDFSRAAHPNRHAVQVQCYSIGQIPRFQSRVFNIPLVLASEVVNPAVVEELQVLSALDGDMQSLMTLFPEGEGVNYAALLAACEHNQLEAVNFFLSQDADVNYPIDILGVTPGLSLLHVALAHRSPEVAMRLIEAGSRTFNPEDSRNSSPLFRAAEQGYHHIVELLLTGDALERIDTVDPITGVTPLGVAIQSGHSRVFKMLLSNGADITRASHAPLHLAIEGGSLSIVRELLEMGLDVNALSSIGFTPVQDAVREGHPAMIRLLSQHGANLDYQATHASDMDIPPLIYATRAGDIECTRALLEAGANPNVIHAFSGESALALAIRKRNIPLAGLLIEMGAEINTANRSHTHFPLIQAANTGCLEMVQLLLESGVQNIDDSFQRALNLAAERGYADIVEILTPLCAPNQNPQSS
jgi:ankyrin repeat protein